MSDADITGRGFFIINDCEFDLSTFDKCDIIEFPKGTNAEQLFNASKKIFKSDEIKTSAQKAITDALIEKKVLKKYYKLFQAIYKIRLFFLMLLQT